MSKRQKGNNELHIFQPLIQLYYDEAGGPFHTINKYYMFALDQQ